MRARERHMGRGGSVRHWTWWVVCAVLGAAASCAREERPAVVLYSSVDDHLLREVAAEFQRESGIEVRIVGDTEATKTTGLVERLIAEKDRPRADVWWSSEPFGTIRLAGEGVLEPYAGEGTAAWPREYRAADGTWYAFASRARVIVYNPRRVERPPATLAELTDPRFRGRIGMARARFGTTRGHMGALLAQFGEPAFGAWAEALRANGVRIYDGNASVVRAVAFGEIDAGLTDTDDVYAGQREGWPVEMVLAPAALGGAAAEGAPDGAMLVPNTAALVRGGPNRERADRLMAFLLSERVERMLASSESRNTPVREQLAGELGVRLDGAILPDLERASEAIAPAMALIHDN